MLSRVTRWLDKVLMVNVTVSVSSPTANTAPTNVTNMYPNGVFLPAHAPTHTASQVDPNDSS